MSAKQTTELDADIVAAFEALDATAPEGDLDEFEERWLARLEEENMSEISNETTTAAEDASSAAMSNAGELHASDDRELHDIKVLAETTKLRISQRMAAQVDAEEALLSVSATSLALSTISLPDPSKDPQDVAGGASAAATAAGHDEDTGLPAWIYAAISAVAAAAVVFFLLRGQKSEPPQVAINDSPAAMPAEPLDPAGARQADPGAAAWGSTNPEGVAGSGAGNGIDGTAGAGVPPGGDSATATAGGAQGDDGQNGDAKDSSAEAQRAATTRTGGTADTARSTRRASAGAASSKADQTADTSAADDTATRDDPAASTNTASATKKPAKKPDALEDLLAEASGGAAGTGTAGAGQQAANSKPARTELERGDIKKAMTPIAPKAQACYDETQLSGMVTVMIEFRVEPSGTISSASAKGKFKGTPTGDCVSAAVKTATLPAYDGAPMTFTYPFLLTQ